MRRARDLRAVRVWEGMTGAEALRAAELLGAEVEVGHRHGEVRFRHVAHPRAVVTHAGRKDAARHVVRWLREVQEALVVLEAWWSRRPVALEPAGEYGGPE
ncbi:MAG: hypothetical protein BWX64_02212 [Acidobacteria bacterium ADurb.Bin051]|jgi:hypothetical protein|nr:MAG: hypothetical protein BWX64_02212 [Acidobacteria bacterium ADurb.Bin051]